MALLSTARIEHRKPLALALGQILFVARTLGIIGSMLICIAGHGLWRLFRLPSPWPQMFLHSINWICGVIPRFYGKRLKRNVFYAANHISWMDIPLIAGFTGCTFVAQDGIKSWPIVGWLCKLNRTIFVSREDRMSVDKQVANLKAAIDGKQPVTIFPEGTTNDGTFLNPFKPALFAVLSPPPPGMMVQPVFISYGKDTDEIAWVGEETAPANAWRLLSRLKPMAARVYYLEPFDPSDYANRKEIAGEVRSRISAMVDAGGHLPRRI
ncbi:lysophospholipid acyltransferase family protein [Sphingorhabdus arenilitoris]|uniref:Lysophospholipid acyltransferase family protein n=1 Tax=Sphingorhabdus arenilitoris TaxID=1490041 RepID=A0ABV8RG59_9SPHN